MITQEEREVLKKILRNRSSSDVRALARWLFPEAEIAQNLTPCQSDILRKIAFKEEKRINIRAMTRYGKTNVVALAICIYILLNEDKRIKLVAPTNNHAEVLKNYLTELILNSRDQILVNLSHLSTDQKEERLRAEVSQKRLTFKNGCEYQILSVAGQEGNQLMGQGGDLIVVDESALINRRQYAKITRLLGDDPENAILVELLNPWDRDTPAYDHSISDRYDTIKIDYRTALAEGRVTEEFIQEQREELTHIEFTVLYESEFPDSSEDSLFKVSEVEKAFKQEGLSLQKKYEFLKRRVEDEPERSKNEREKIKEFAIVISVDPADKGLDKTVCLWGFRRRNYYEFIGHFAEEKSDTMNLTKRTYNKIAEYRATYPEAQIEVKIDRAGVGAGLLSNLMEWFKGDTQVQVIGAEFGAKAHDSTRFQNKKAENYWRTSNMIRDDLIKTPKIPQLKTQLLNMKWEYSSSYKIKIKDPDSGSPDYADALVIGTWHEEEEHNSLIVEYL